MNHESLTCLLEHLPKVPISQIEEDQRSCGICWEAFISIAPDPDGPSSGQQESTVSASNYTLEKTTPFPVHASTSTSHVAAKTETCVDREMLPEMCTEYQRHRQGKALDLEAPMTWVISVLSTILCKCNVVTRSAGIVFGLGKV